ncbi:MAG TPA: hypothetical protein VF721_12390 [Pyrinomonadaceae bacterium]|jgi:hypothetical protein
MINLKTLCLLFSLSGFFINCSSIKPPPFTPIQSPAIKEGERFDSVEGNFTINIFQAPSQTLDLGTETAHKKGIDAGKMFIWKIEGTSNSERTFYTVSYSNPFDSDGNAMPHNFDDMNIGFRKGIARQGAKLISEREISYDKYPGREFRYVASNRVKFIGRSYLIKTMDYQIVGGYVDDKNEKEVLEVLDSFKLLTDKM